MTKKKPYQRTRNNVIAFRVNDEEKEILNSKAELSGLSKQDYLIHCITQRNYVIDARNTRVQRAIYNQINEFIELLKKQPFIKDWEYTDIEVLEYLLRIIISIKKGTQNKVELEPRQ
ncbi:plasmid mobilization protein [Faecalitalea cylindroides]|uniref:plasmid mobilization protein n=1 Tax=Faecalitalea cylindroides TaxID=39483 RepID=UPI001957327C|nr:hypothetical protein [Faecalitalea cylindroides]MBM6652730.1 hypothetical protein [Faecalitalea cylindroides]